MKTFPLTRQQILQWLHMAVLAVGINCGNFSLDRLVPTMNWGPDQLTEIRYLSLPVILFLLFLRRRAVPEPMENQREPLLALGMLGVFIAYLMFRIDFGAGTAAVYLVLEEYLLTFAYGVFAWLSLRTLRDAGIFLMITMALLLAVLGAYFVSEIMLERTLWATGYYFSRMFFVGFCVALFMLFRRMDKGSQRTALSWVMGLLAAGFLFAGLLTVMRAAGLFYGLGLIGFGTLLLALRAYGRLAIIMGMAVLAFGAVLVLEKDVIQYKQKAYSPYSAPAPGTTIGSVQAEAAAEPAAAPVAAPVAAPIAAESDPQQEICDRDTAAYLASHDLLVTSTEYTCSENISLRDADGRVRMILTALKNVLSPWFGNGVGTYRFLDMARSNDRPVQYYTYPHNIYVQFYNETGLVGLGLIGLSILFVLSTCLRVFLAPGSPSTVGILCLIPMFFLLSGAVAGDFFDIRFVWTTPFLLAALMPTDNRESTT